MLSKIQLMVLFVIKNIQKFQCIESSECSECQIYVGLTSFFFKYIYLKIIFDTMYTKQEPAINNNFHHITNFFLDQQIDEKYMI